MGLAAPKNRSKIGDDPQNTTWANNTSRFGHRILTTQGWKPGTALGASNAAHAAHYTAASQSHIRVLLKDDNLGLGAKRGSERAENFGLAGLENILGRLNGKEDAVKKEEERREQAEKSFYVYRKYGLMNFVSGGFLVGERIEKQLELKKEVVIKGEPRLDSGSSVGTSKKRKRKRKDHDDVEVKIEDVETQPRLKRKKKSMNLRDEVRKNIEQEASSEEKDKMSKKDKKKEKKEKGLKKGNANSTEARIFGVDLPAPILDPEALTDKAKRKAEKKARKEEKKTRKARKKVAKVAVESKTEADESGSEDRDESPSIPNASTPATRSSIPVLSAAGLTFGARGMHSVRAKWIRQKKAASMDPQALKEIFMIKTPS